MDAKTLEERARALAALKARNARRPVRPTQRDLAAGSAPASDRRPR